MLNKIDHIGIAVNKIDDSLKFYKTLGIFPSHIEIVASQKVKTAFLTIGDIHIELLEPISEDSPITSFLAKKGEGMHHIAYQVEDIEKALVLLKDNGMELINDKPIAGANNTKIAFIHPKSVSGVLTELCQKL